jgi:hypothetical protein
MPSPHGVPSAWRPGQRLKACSGSANSASARLAASPWRRRRSDSMSVKRASSLAAKGRSGPTAAPKPPARAGLALHDATSVTAASDTGSSTGGAAARHRGHRTMVAPGASSLLTVRRAHSRHSAWAAVQPRRTPGEPSAAHTGHSDNTKPGRHSATSGARANDSLVIAAGSPSLPPPRPPWGERAGGKGKAPVEGVDTSFRASRNSPPRQGRSLGACAQPLANNAGRHSGTPLVGSTSRSGRAPCSTCARTCSSLKPG